MQMLYNSDSFTVVAIGPDADAGDAPGNASQTAHSGYEIVDKFARRGIFIDGAVAERFRLGVESLMQGRPSEDDLDDFIAGFTTMAQHPLVLH